VYFAKALEEPDRKNLSLWAVASALAFTTHYFSVVLVVPEFIWLFARTRKHPSREARRDSRLALAAVAAAGLAVAPLAFYQAASGRGGWIADIDLGERITEFAQQFAVGPTGERIPFAFPIAAALVAVALVLLARKSDAAERRGVRIAGILGGLVVLVPLALSLVGADRFIAKNVLPALVPLALVVSTGIGARRGGIAGPLIGGALCALSVTVVVLVALEPRLQRTDFRGAARVIARTGAKQAIVTPSSPAALRLYLRRGGRLSVDQQLDAPGGRDLERGGVRISDVVVINPPRLPRLFGFGVWDRRRLGPIRLVRLHSDRARLVSHRALAALLAGSDEEPQLLVYTPGTIARFRAH